MIQNHKDYDVTIYSDELTQTSTRLNKRYDYDVGDDCQPNGHIQGYKVVSFLPSRKTCM
ncbi:hypothetical protein IIA28_12860 [candidate division KSB1 bacterium]|nr:hypothetical protein [candidate division KSB1 bacterium]